MTYIASVYWNNNNNNHRTIDGEIVSSIVVYQYFIIIIIIFFKQILNPEQERCEQRRVDLVDPRTGFTGWYYCTSESCPNIFLRSIDLMRSCDHL